ncbi:MAG: 16S rRNA (cytidine(1402)-2'-O)-methyltransferase [Pseudomonadota bacterium]
MSGQMYVAATPIGNLSDVSHRLLEVLEMADTVLAEDTRVTGRLLQHLGVRAQLTSVHEHNEAGQVDRVLQQLKAGATLVLVSDAGTPLISDPGFRLVRAAREADYAVIPVPGPSAVAAALSVSGLATDAFTFRGFPSAKSSERKRQYRTWGNEAPTQVVFESSHRISASLKDAAAVLGDERPAFLAREMTKAFEQYRAGTLSSLAAEVAAGDIPAKGEFVLLIAGAPAAQAPDQARVAEVVATLRAELPASQAARLASRITGAPKRVCYDLAIAADPESAT